jgi:hypothetical protein
MSNESQCSQILKHLQSGKSITALDALYQFGSLRLGARIWDLRQRGVKIKAEMIEITSKSVYDGKKRITRYSLIKS